MNKIRVIDLLNKIANGEEVPKKIKVYNREDSIYEYRAIKGTSFKRYFNIITEERLGHDWRLDGDILNSEVEIIEDKEDINIQDIEKLDLDALNGIDGFTLTQIEEICYGKINELVQAIKQLDKTKEDK